MKRFSLLFLFALSTFFVSAQNTLGVTYTSANVDEGYTLFTHPSSKIVYLIDNCGRVLKQWEFFENAGLTTYLLPNGNLLYAGKDSLTIHDWDDNPVWSYPTTANGIRAHHDIEPLPNGNILCIAASTRTSAELLDEGRDPNLIGASFKLDGIVEIEPVGANGGNIVWEWSFWDHLIQDYDATKNNFGVVEDHPELIDFNYDHGDYTDWNHVNGIDYNAALDQIIISSRNFDEVYIIDHSTTMAESQGHSGGNAGRGGDFLWRWGNAETYGQGTPSDRHIDGPHDPKWVNDGYLHEGKITIFDNGGDGTGLASEVVMVDPTVTGSNYTMTAGEFDPQVPFSVWSGNNVPTPLFSPKKSGAMALPNGGYIVCESQGGRFVEVNEQGEVVWIYINPVTQQGIQDQYYTFTGFENEAFRAEKYPVNYAGFNGRQFDGSQILEDVNNLSDGCISTASIAANDPIQIQVVNPVENESLEIQGADANAQFELVNLNGQVLDRWEGASRQLDVTAGVYLLNWRSGATTGSVRVLIQ